MSTRGASDKNPVSTQLKRRWQAFPHMHVALLVVICSSRSHHTLKFLTDPSTFASISMGRGSAWNAHDIDVVRGWLAAGKTTTAMAKLRTDWSRSSIKKLVARLRAPGGETAHVFTSQAVLHSGFQRPVGRASRPNCPHCLGCRLTLSRKGLGPPVSQRGGCCTTDWQKKPYKPIKSAADRTCHSSPSHGIFVA